MNNFKKKFENIDGTQLLTREQLRTIVGGDTCGNCPEGEFLCTCDNGSSTCLKNGSTAPGSVKACQDYCG